LTLFLIALLKVKCDTIVTYSEKDLALEVERKCPKRFCLFDAHNQISKSTKDQIENRLKDIYRKSGTKVFIFVTKAIKTYSEFFLLNLMQIIGVKYDKDTLARDYIGLLFVENYYGKVFYQYGKNIKNGKDMRVIINSFVKKIPSLGIGNTIVNIVKTMDPKHIRENINKTYEEDELLNAIEKNEKIIFDPEGYVDHKYMEEINEYMKLLNKNRRINVHFVYIYGMKFVYSIERLYDSIEKILKKKYSGNSILFFYDKSKDWIKYVIKGTRHNAYINNCIYDISKKYLRNDFGAFTLETLKKIYVDA
jgi:hypothetical protein